jgi:hypothetical protein
VIFCNELKKFNLSLYYDGNNHLNYLKKVEAIFKSLKNNNKLESFKFDLELNKSKNT